MRVSTKEMIELSSKENIKNIKEGVKKFVNLDTKTKAPNTQAPKITSSKLIQTLLKDLSLNAKTKESVSESLKQNEISKQVQNTSKELNTLLNSIKSDKSLFKFAPILEKLLLHVKDINPQNIKTSLLNSGVLMESKMANQTKDIMPENLKEVLATLKKYISNDSPKILKTIDLLLNAKKADKNFFNTIQNLIKDIKQDVNLVKSVSLPLTKLESAIKQNAPIKDILLQLKNEIKKESLHVKSIDVLLSSKKMDKGFKNNLENLIKDIKKDVVLPNKIDNILTKLQNALEKNTHIKHTLLELKQEIQKNIPKSTLHVETINRLLDAKKVDKVFMQDIKTLLSDLKAKPLVKITAKLDNIAQESKLIESKISNLVEIPPKEIEKVTSNIKESMTELKELISKTSINEKAQITNIANQIIATKEVFPKSLNNASVSEQIKQVVNILKSELVKTDIKSPLHVEVEKLANKLEFTIKEQIQSKKIVPNQNLKMPLKPELLNDVKATLLSIKHEINSTQTPIHKDILVQVDRLLTHIDYFQLVSLSSNSLTSYLPFSWDSLEGGQISLKRLKENRFFCEINLKLKEYGSIDLMLMLFEDVHVNVSFFTQNKDFLELVQENLLALKQGMNKLGLVPSNIQLFDSKKDKKLKEDTRNYASSMELGNGINIEI
ncbi:flagellar hook-length control protein FliK [Sulfurospirillum sp. 1307]